MPIYCQLLLASNQRETSRPPFFLEHCVNFSLLATAQRGRSFVSDYIGQTSLASKKNKNKNGKWAQKIKPHDRPTTRSDVKHVRRRASRAIKANSCEESDLNATDREDGGTSLNCQTVRTRFWGRFRGETPRTVTKCQVHLLPWSWRRSGANKCGLTNFWFLEMHTMWH